MGRTKRILATLAFAFGLNALAAGAAVAQDQEGAGAAAAEEPPARKPPPGFQPVKGKTTENVDASRLVIAAYAVFFFGLFGYLIYVVKKQSDIAKEMTELAEQVKRAEKS